VSDAQVRLLTLAITSLGHQTQGANFITSAQFNHKPQDKVFLDWEQIQAGGSLVFKVSAKADEKGWGTQSKHLPSGLNGQPK